MEKNKGKILSIALIAILLASVITAASIVYEPSVTDPAANNPDETGIDTVDDTDQEPLWGETVQLNVTLPMTVTVNLSEIGGSAAQQMVNTGGSIWSITTNVSAGTVPKLYNLTVNATDIYGNSNTSVTIQMRVIKNGDATGNGVRNVGDGARCSNYWVNSTTYPIYGGNTTVDVNGDGVFTQADCTYLLNNISYPGNPAYILK